MNNAVRSTLAGLFLCGVLTSLTAHAQSESLSGDALVDRLTKQLVQAVPLAEIARMAADSDPSWPMSGVSVDVSKQVTAEQLACMRQEMISQENYLVVKRGLVKAFVANHPEEARAAVGLLEQGREPMRDAMLAGMQTGGNRDAVKESVDFSKYTPSQVMAVVELTSSPRHSELRALIGLPDSATDSKTSKGIEYEITMVMLTAMERCRIPMSVFRGAARK